MVRQLLAGLLTPLLSDPASGAHQRQKQGIMRGTDLEPLPIRPGNTEIPDASNWTLPTIEYLEHMLEVLRRWVEEAEKQDGH